MTWQNINKRNRGSFKYVVCSVAINKSTTVLEDKEMKTARQAGLLIYCEREEKIKNNI